MAKTKYYVTNNQGVRILARTSDHDYNYALVDKSKINEGKKGIYACSGTFDNIMKQYNYYHKVYSLNMDYYEKKDNKEYYLQAKNLLENLSIMDLEKEVK